MRRILPVAAAAAALALPASSFAGTASVDGEGDVSYVAAPGETNHVIAVADPPADLRIVDTGAPVVAGAGCTAVSGNEVVCDVDFDFHFLVTVNVGDLNDFVLASGTFLVRLLGGEGNDDLNSLAYGRS
jgi:hypothetical protein